MSKDTIGQILRRKGISRRDFLKFSGLLAGSMGLGSLPPLQASGVPSFLGAGPGLTGAVARALMSKPRLPVLWLEFQDCAGCTEALTRSQAPTVTDLVLNTISIEYHETLSTAAGFQLEENKAQIMKTYAGKYVLVVEGSIPTGLNGDYCTIGGRPALELLHEAAQGAAAVIATGNCATFGGIPKAKPNPTGAQGVWEIITDKPVVNISGCPAIPEVFTGTLVHFIVFGALPELDRLKRPKTFYGNTIHDHCVRRPFYEEGRFALSFDDQGARKGWCLYKLGCKGPTTYNSCALMKWEEGLSYPVQSGHPCLGCSEPNFWDGGGFYQAQSVPLSKPTLTALGIAAVAGAVAGAGIAATNRARAR